MNLLTTIVSIVTVALVIASPSGFNNAPLPLTNGNCNYNNGYITETGISRPATRREVEIIKEYQNELNDQNRGSRRSKQLKTPCLCSPAACENNNVNLINRNNGYGSNPTVGNQDRPLNTQDRSGSQFNSQRERQPYQTDRTVYGSNRGYGNPTPVPQERYDDQRNGGYPTRSPYEYRTEGPRQIQMDRNGNVQSKEGRNIIQSISQEPNSFIQNTRQNAIGNNIRQSISRKKRSSEPKVADLLNRIKRDPRDETYIYEQQKTETEWLKHIENVKQTAGGNNIKQSISRKKRSPDNSIYTHIQDTKHNHHIKIVKDVKQKAVGDRIEQSISRKKRSPEPRVVANNLQYARGNNIQTVIRGSEAAGADVIGKTQIVIGDHSVAEIDYSRR